MRTTLRRAATFLALFLALAFVVVLVNQTAQLVALAGRLHPAAGEATLWGLVLLYVACLGVPVVLWLRLPPAHYPPTSAEDPAFEDHLAALRKRLGRNPRLAGQPLETREDVEAALQSLDEGVDEEIKATGSQVFMTTAISQNGSLDAVVVLAIQSKLVWRIAHHYYQRPTLRDLGYLYANVAATAFLAGELEDLDVTEQLEPIISSALGSAIGAVPGLQAASALLVNSVTSGTANAFMTLRVGYIAREYCSSVVVEERGALRRHAITQAAGALGSIASSGAKRVASSLVKSSTRGVSRAVTGMGGAVRDAGSSVVNRVRRKGDEESGTNDALVGGPVASEIEVRRPTAEDDDRLLGPRRGVRQVGGDRAQRTDLARPTEGDCRGGGGRPADPAPGPSGGRGRGRAPSIPGDPPPASGPRRDGSQGAQAGTGERRQVADR